MKTKEPIIRIGRGQRGQAIVYVALAVFLILLAALALGVDGSHVYADNGQHTITVTVTFSNPSSFKDGNITVTTAYDLPTLTPLTAFLAPSGKYHIVSTCTMKMG